MYDHSVYLTRVLYCESQNTSWEDVPTCVPVEKHTVRIFASDRVLWSALASGYAFRGVFASVTHLRLCIVLYGVLLETTGYMLDNHAVCAPDGPRLLSRMHDLHPNSSREIK